MKYEKLQKCRVCKSDDFLGVLNLGHQYLTGVFPVKKNDEITKGPLDLKWCMKCGLLQLGSSYSLSEMYGDNYGYRSGLNKSMVDHLSNKIHKLEKFMHLNSGDIVVDIGSNDATLLKSYTVNGLKKIGIDPTGIKFKEYYPDDITLIDDFFSSKAYNQIEKRKAKIVTSIAMFYDLEDPVSFARQIEEILDDDGIWHFEQSYLPSMLRLISYDTICHEHLEYYSLTIVKKILEEAGLKIIDVIMNSVNGGSFAVTVVKSSNNTVKSNAPIINWLLDQEILMGLNTPKPYREFEEKVFKHKLDLVRLVNTLNKDNKRILGYGASTKGNVLLQFCGFTEKDIPAIAEVNEEKFGRYTPGTNIPIISEKEAHVMKPDYFLVLPWHFKESIVKRERDYLDSGGKLIFPFPEIEIIS